MFTAPSPTTEATASRLPSDEWHHERKEPPVLTQVAEGVLVHQSELLRNNTVVVQGRARRAAHRPRDHG